MKVFLRVVIVLLAISTSVMLAGTAASARAVAGLSSATAASGMTGSMVPAVGTWPVVSQGTANSTVTVRTLQYLLNAHGAGLTVDGLFGPRTDCAVRNYQATHGLTVDGVVGSRTWSSLLVTVRRGSVGSAVKAFQEQMNARSIAAGGEASLVVDGVFGPRTEAAAFYIQNRLADYWGIAVDGIVGPETWQPLISNVLPRG